MPGTLKENIEFQGEFNFPKLKKGNFGILKNLYISTCIDEHMLGYGLDTPIDIKRRDKLNISENFPYPIDYKFNSRGFRDQEWPVNLKDCIWVIGDSNVLGIGVPEKFLFTKILQEISGKQVINIGNYSAFNIWISLSVRGIVEEIDPKNIVVVWTHLSKRIRPDEPLHYSQNDLLHFLKCVSIVNKAKNNCNIIQLCSPNILQEKDIDYFLKFKNFIGLIDQIDYARDGFHIGIETHRQVANDISSLLC